MTGPHPTPRRRRRVTWPRIAGRVEVDGDSMRPALLPGDRLVVVRARRVRPGDVVAVVDPREEGRVVVKRVEEVLPDGTCRVVGDNRAASTDSRVFGPVPPAGVRGRVVYRYAPADRAGRIGRGVAGRAGNARPV